MGRLSTQDKDRKIISENPDATPKQLLALGLSNDAYESILQEQESKKEPAKTAAKVEPQDIAKEQPQTQTANDDHGPVMPTVERQSAAVPKLQVAQTLYDGDNVVVVGPDGSRTPMTRSAAERFKRGGRNANYQIEG